MKPYQIGNSKIGKHSSHLVQWIVVICNSWVPSIELLPIITPLNTTKLLRRRRRIIWPLRGRRWWCIGWYWRWWRCIGWYGRWRRCIWWNSRMIHIFLAVWPPWIPIIVIPCRRARPVGRTLPLPPTILPCKLTPHQPQISSTQSCNSSSSALSLAFSRVDQTKAAALDLRRLHEYMNDKQDRKWEIMRDPLNKLQSRLRALVKHTLTSQLARWNFQFFLANQTRTKKAAADIYRLRRVSTQFLRPTFEVGKLHDDPHLIKISLWDTSPPLNIQDTSFTVTRS